MMMVVVVVVVPSSESNWYYMPPRYENDNGACKLRITAPCNLGEGGDVEMPSLEIPSFIFIYQVERCQVARLIPPLSLLLRSRILHESFSPFIE